LNRHMTLQEATIMPQPKKHNSAAARQAAYHQRREKERLEYLKSQGLLALPSIPTVPGYRRWRQALAHAGALLEMVASEMEQYADDRSEKWNASDRAGDFRQRIEQVTDVHDQLSDLDI